MAGDGHPQDTPCACCGGAGRIRPGRHPLCATAIQQRDPRSPAQLRRIARAQQLALRGIAFDRHGRLLLEHGGWYVDYESGEVRT